MRLLSDEANWEAAKEALTRADPVMEKLVLQAGETRLKSRGAPFETLLRSVAGQQISTKAADAIWARFKAVCPAGTPEEIRETGEDALSACGFSKRKIVYLKDLAENFISGAVDPAKWPEMSDEEIVASLVQVRGIGRWTAEMLLIFCLMRPDVMPDGDLGLRRAVCRHYFAGEEKKPAEIRRFAERWRPWRTAATWFLWRSLTPIPVEY